jgi:hypothetical protein
MMMSVGFRRLWKETVMKVVVLRIVAFVSCYLDTVCFLGAES